ncbi:heme-binding protein [Modestobacter sp. I12A-02628]|uniref:Heme-binding protein n=1 Tax=Goekera deserti TaxID=2497753 RepID=A0A7K3WDX4_9ACTN|nr:heme-binding protein [Goekera deserti]MPQ97424.1 heme-binding protein [Goekera deserti]NDI47975.1 heme-binding protein [Goekera deserti]NEL53723.1 heme-binding protein [Goekera deserti]
MRAPLTFEMAHEAALAVLESGRRDAARLCVAVVDRSGGLVVLLCDDRVGPVAVETARRKAYTAAVTGQSTRAFAAFAARPEMAVAPPSQVDRRLLAVPGGLPILVEDDEVIGAVGVGGAHGDVDERAAASGIERIAPLLFPTD